MSKDNYSVELFPAALRDLDNIYAYYYKQSQELEIADKAAKVIKDSLYRLSFMPASHPKMQDKRLIKKGLRKLICAEYVIPFIINEEKKIVSIVRIFHGRMNYKKHL